MRNFIFLFALLLQCHVARAEDVSKGNIIAIENSKTGSKEWWHPQGTEDDRAPMGFTTKFSFDPEETVEVKINSTFSNYSFSIYRLGYYGGLGGRLIHNSTISEPTVQPPCNFMKQFLMTDCDNWEITTTWTLPADSVTGVYLIVLEAWQGDGSRLRGHYIPFVVRRSGKTNKKGADILFKMSDLTWVAYNKFGGWNLYRGNGSFDFSSRAKGASYNRPFTNRLPKMQGGQHQNFLFGTEFPLLFWLERHGYDVVYASCGDVEWFGQHHMLAGRFKTILSVGHDEYWTTAMLTSHENARNQGANLAFLSGNEIFWQVKWMDNWRKGKLSKRMVLCKKETIDGKGSFTSLDWTGTFIDPRYRPALHTNELTGQSFLVNGLRHDGIEVPAADTRMRFWRNTTIYKSKSTAKLPKGVLGYEWDEVLDDCHRPVGLISLSSTTINVSGYAMENYGASYKGNKVATHRLSMYKHHHQYGDLELQLFCASDNSSTNASTTPPPSSSSSSSSSSTHARRVKPDPLVFAAGTVQWSWGLSDWHDADTATPVDASMQQATVNMLADMYVLASALDPTAASPSLHVSRPSGDFTAPMSLIRYPVGRKVGRKTKVVRIGTMSSADGPPRHVLFVNGSASDVGGYVASVEVSLDGGETWNLARGRADWSFMHVFNSSASSKVCGNGYLPSSIPGVVHSLHIMTRAVDDSGNLEPCFSQPSDVKAAADGKQRHLHRHLKHASASAAVVGCLPCNSLIKRFNQIDIKYIL